MNKSATIAHTLAEDSLLLELLGSQKRIQQGRYSSGESLNPPLVRISTEENIPILENEEGVLAEHCICTLTLIAEENFEPIEARLIQLMEGLGFRTESIKESPSTRAEWITHALQFSHAELRA